MSVRNTPIAVLVTVALMTAAGLPGVAVELPKDANAQTNEISKALAQTKPGHGASVGVTDDAAAARAKAARAAAQATAASSSANSSRTRTSAP